jgi:hypothetical protein
MLNEIVVSQVKDPYPLLKRRYDEISKALKKIDLKRPAELINILQKTDDEKVETNNNNQKKYFISQLTTKLIEQNVDMSKINLDEIYDNTISKQRMLYSQQHIRQNSKINQKNFASTLISKVSKLFRFKL